MCKEVSNQISLRCDFIYDSFNWLSGIKIVYFLQFILLGNYIV